MSANSSDSEVSLGDWTVVDNAGTIQGNESETSSDFVTLEENTDTVEYHKQKEDADADLTVAQQPNAAEPETLYDQNESIKEPQTVKDEIQELKIKYFEMPAEQVATIETTPEEKTVENVVTATGDSDDEEVEDLTKMEFSQSLQDVLHALINNEGTQDGYVTAELPAVVKPIPIRQPSSSSDSDSDYVRIDPSNIPDENEDTSSTQAAGSLTSSAGSSLDTFCFFPRKRLQVEGGDDPCDRPDSPDTLDLNEEDESSSYVDEYSLYSTLGDISPVALKPAVRRYRHYRDDGLNTKLNLMLILVVTAGLALGLGHFIGSSNENLQKQKVQEGQILRLKSLQNELLTCLENDEMMELELDNMMAELDQQRNKYETIMMQEKRPDTAHISPIPESDDISDEQTVIELPLSKDEKTNDNVIILPINDMTEPASEDDAYAQIEDDSQIDHQDSHDGWVEEHDMVYEQSEEDVVSDIQLNVQESLDVQLEHYSSDVFIEDEVSAHDQDSAIIHLKYQDVHGEEEVDDQLAGNSPVKLEEFHTNERKHQEGTTGLLFARQPNFVSPAPEDELMEEEDNDLDSLNLVLAPPKKPLSEQLQSVHDAKGDTGSEDYESEISSWEEQISSENVEVEIDEPVDEVIGSDEVSAHDQDSAIIHLKYQDVHGEQEVDDQVVGNSPVKLEEFHTIERKHRGGTTGLLFAHRPQFVSPAPEDERMGEKDNDLDSFNLVLAPPKKPLSEQLKSVHDAKGDTGSEDYESEISSWEEQISNENIEVEIDEPVDELIGSDNQETVYPTIVMVDEDTPVELYDEQTLPDEIESNETELSPEIISCQRKVMQLQNGLEYEHGRAEMWRSLFVEEHEKKQESCSNDPGLSFFTCINMFVPRVDISDIMKQMNATPLTNFTETMADYYSSSGDTLVNLTETLKEQWVKVLHFTQSEEFSSYVETSKEAILSLNDLLKDKIDEIKAFAKSEEFAAYSEKTKSAWSSVSDTLHEKWQQLKNYTVSKEFKSKVTKLGESIQKTWQSVQNYSVKILKGEDTSGTLSSVTDTIKKTVDSTWKGVKETVQHVLKKKENSANGKPTKGKKRWMRSIRLPGEEKTMTERIHDRRAGEYSYREAKKAWMRKMQQARENRRAGNAPGQKRTKKWLKAIKFPGEEIKDKLWQWNFWNDEVETKPEIDEEQEQTMYERMMDAEKQSENTGKQHQPRQTSKGIRQEDTAHCWDDFEDDRDIHCHGNQECIGKQVEGARKLYVELLHYRQWLKDHHYKKDIKEIEEFLDDLEEFMDDPHPDDNDLDELQEDFEDVLEDMEKRAKKHNRKQEKERQLQEKQLEKIRQKSDKELKKETIEDEEEVKDEKKQGNGHRKKKHAMGNANTVRREFNQETAFKHSIKGAGHPGSQESKGDADWFFKRAVDRQEQRHLLTYNVEDQTLNNWFFSRARSRDEQRVGFTMWDMYTWFADRYEQRQEWRKYQMDDQSNWFLRRP
ncbi:uncharacterized protein LOC100374236 isoform X2 [Saccoglossus kowalevskii]